MYHPFQAARDSIRPTAPKLPVRETPGTEVSAGPAPAGRDEEDRLVHAGERSRRGDRNGERSSRRAESALNVHRAVLPGLVPAGVPEGEIDDEVTRGPPRVGGRTSGRS